MKSIAVRGLISVGLLSTLGCGVLGSTSKNDDPTPTVSVSPSISSSPSATPSPSISPSPKPATQIITSTQPSKIAPSPTKAKEPVYVPDPVIASEPAYEPAPSSVYYKNCAAARAAGAAPVRRGQPGYGKHLDRDGDGVGCER